MGRCSPLALPLNLFLTLPLIMIKLKPALAGPARSQGPPLPLDTSRRSQVTQAAALDSEDTEAHKTRREGRRDLPSLLFSLLPSLVYSAVITTNHS